MKALTVRQPHAWAIVHGGKTIENRTTAWKYRGPLLIHAGLAKPEQHNESSRAHRAAHGTEIPTELVFGAIIGIVDLVDAHDHTGTVVCDNPWGLPPGPDNGWRITHLELANPRALAEPVPCKGALGLWTPPAEVLDQVTAQLGEVV